MEKESSHLDLLIEGCNVKIMLIHSSETTDPYRYVDLRNILEIIKQKGLIEEFNFVYEMVETVKVAKHLVEMRKVSMSPKKGEN